MVKSCCIKWVVLCMLVGYSQTCFSMDFVRKLERGVNQLGRRAGEYVDRTARKAERTAQDADTLSQIFEVHHKLSGAYHTVLDPVVREIHADPTKTAHLLTAGVGFCSFTCWALGALGKVSSLSRLLRLVVASGVTVATYLKAPSFVQKHPVLTAHIYPSVSAPLVGRALLELGARGYCWGSGANFVATSAAGLLVSSYHKDTRDFRKSIFGW